MYDHVSWDFLLSVIGKMGLGKKWIEQIGWCILIVKFTVLVNCSLSNFFQSFRDLRLRIATRQVRDGSSYPNLTSFIQNNSHPHPIKKIKKDRASILAPF